MVLRDIWGWLRQQVFSISSTPTLFNPYGSDVFQCDLARGFEIRRKNLQNYVSAFPQTPTFLAIGEAPGWRGCRFSGVPFTSEAQLCGHTLPFAGQQSSNHSRPYSETSATLFWRQMHSFHPDFFVWNAIPFHPYQQGQPLSNRTPSATEIDRYSELLAELHSLLKPQVVIVIGRSAERAARQIGVPAHYVRHPAHGGVAAFQAGIERAFARRELVC